MTKTAITDKERERMLDEIKKNPQFAEICNTIIPQLTKEILEKEVENDESFEQSSFSGLLINFNDETIHFNKNNDTNNTDERNIGLVYPNTNGPRHVNKYSDSDRLITEFWNKFNLNSGNEIREELDYSQLRNFLAEKNLDKYVDQTMLKSALTECNSTYPQTNQYSCGEMYYQQTVYSAFSRLFMAFSSNLNLYAADEDVHSSVLSKIIKKNESDIKNCTVTVQPDAASTISRTLNPFGMMEIKPNQYSWDLNQRRDYNKCVMLTASTAVVMKNAKMEGSDIVLPFLIGRGSLASLYVTVWNGENSNIEIQKVKSLVNTDIAASRLPRKKFFISLVALLARIRSKIDNPKFTSLFGQSRRVDEDAEKAFTSNETKKRGADDLQESNDDENVSSSRSSKKQRSQSNKQKEELALNAVQNLGMFIRVKYPWLRVVNCWEENSSISYQNVSPYVFKGIHRESGKEVFLKVWREGEDKVECSEIELEYKYHKLAQDRKVPTAPLITNKLLRSTVSNVHFYVLATAYAGTHDVPKNDIWPYSIQLVSALINLHENAFLLHCDVKPDNVTWNSSTKSLYLIDFEHAQPEESAKAYRCTVGYEAPEIVSGHRHTRSTDAYAVGRTLIKILDKVSNAEEFTEIREIANHLVKEVNERWTLDSALKALKTANFSQAENKSSVTEVLSPTKKIRRV